MRQEGETKVNVSEVLPSLRNYTKKIESTEENSKFGKVKLQGKMK